jgi:hypothetical protein
MSDNGMVRPCSGPASTRSWQGEPKQGVRETIDTAGPRNNQGIQVAGFSQATLPDETVDSVNTIAKEPMGDAQTVRSDHRRHHVAQARHHGFDGPLQLVEIGLGHRRRGRAQERIIPTLTMIDRRLPNRVLRWT